MSFFHNFYQFSFFSPFVWLYDRNSSELELRIAIDSGSGSTKASAGIFNLRKQKYTEYLGSRKVLIPHQAHILKSDNKMLTESFMQESLSKMLQLIDGFKISGVHKIKCSGIATAWARNATNTDDYLKILAKNNINLMPISQEEEGEIGYKSVVNINKLNHKVVVFDIGGGSFQITHKLNDYIKVFNGEYGSSNFAAEVRDITGVRKDYFNSDDINKALKFAKDKLCNIPENLSVNSFEGIGSFLNINIKLLTKEDYIDLNTVNLLIDQFSNLTEESALKIYPKVGETFIGDCQTDLLLLKSIMEKTGVNLIKFNPSTSKDFILNSADFWDDCVASNNNVLCDDISYFFVPEFA